MKVQKQKIIAVVGPTASGKSSLGTYLAQQLNGEIISADSRQVYRGMYIISRAEKGHMVGVVNPSVQYSAGEYAKQARKIVEKIIANNKLPILVGGTGFYAEALLCTPLPEVPPNKKLRAQLGKKTAAQLFAMLKKLDPRRAKQVDPFNTVRLIRAIELAKALGKTPSLPQEGRYRVLWLGLPQTKDLRVGVEERLRRGMVAEAKRLRRVLSKKRYAELGFEFEYLANYLDKKISNQELIKLIANGERKYALRQMRWFRRNPDIHWVKNKTEALRLAKNFLSR